MLPHGPRASLGINERGPDRRAGTRRPSDAGDLSRNRLAQARRHVKTGVDGGAGGEKSGADTGILLSAFTNFNSLNRLAFYKYHRFKHQMVRVFVYYRHSFMKTRKMGSIEGSGGGGKWNY